MTFKVRTIIPSYTNVPADELTNTWAFDWVGAPITQTYQSLINEIGTLYSLIYGTSSPSSGMAAYWKPASMRMEIIDLSDPQPRYPVFSGTPSTFPTNQSTSTFMPPEVAHVLSFQGPRQSGVPQARRRGRLYLPACVDAAYDTGTPSMLPRLKATVISKWAGLVSTFRSDLIANTDWRWVVWSEMDQASTAVTNGWIDNESDTQRRRGQIAPSRTTWS